MRKFVTTLVAMLAASAALILPVSAANTNSSHPATHCQYKYTYTCDDWYSWDCDGGTTKSCPGGSTSTSEWTSSCSCGASVPRGSESCDTCGATICSYGLACVDCGKGSSYVNHYSHNSIDDPCSHGYMRSHTVYEDCYHGYTSDHTQTDYYNCSSSYPCQNSHPSHSTVNHYYCAQHGWVGTSSTCPGLSVTPREASTSIKYGQTYALNPTIIPESADVAYVSDKESVAKVSADGVITSINKGTAVITITATL